MGQKQTVVVPSGFALSAIVNVLFNKTGSIFIPRLATSLLIKVLLEVQYKIAMTFFSFHMVMVIACLYCACLQWSCMNIS